MDKPTLNERTQANLDRIAASLDELSQYLDELEKSIEKEPDAVQNMKNDDKQPMMGYFLFFFYGIMGQRDVDV